MPDGLHTLELGILADPELVFDALFADEPYSFWLDHRPGTGLSVMGAPAVGSRRLVTLENVTTVHTLSRDGWSESRREHTSAFEMLRELLPSEHPHALPGWVGWLGYEAGAQRMGVPSQPSSTPDALFLEVDRRVILHPDGSARAEIFAEDEVVREWLAQIRDRVAAAEASAGHPRAPDAASTPAFPPANAGAAGRASSRTALHDQPSASSEQPSVSWRHSDEQYLALIHECQRAIHDGDAYLLCLTNEVTVPVQPNPVDLYRRLRATQPAPQAGLIRAGEYALVSTSPELFLRVDVDGMVTTRPIKGTRSRGVDATTDELLRRELAGSVKERAENLMIVDLMRNDFARVAALGTVHVSELFEVESFPAVHQLVSTVTARLADGCTALDALEVSFPPGSMTGTPKHSAMSILNRLEDGPRGVYSGVYGWLGADGTADLAVVIRSVVLTPDGATVGVGGGVTALSDPVQELEEIHLKARALLQALGVKPAHDL